MFILSTYKKVKGIPIYREGSSFSSSSPYKAEWEENPFTYKELKGISVKCVYIYIYILYIYIYPISYPPPRTLLPVPALPVPSTPASSLGVYRIRATDRTV